MDGNQPVLGNTYPAGPQPKFGSTPQVPHGVGGSSNFDRLGRQLGQFGQQIQAANPTQPQPPPFDAVSNSVQGGMGQQGGPLGLMQIMQQFPQIGQFLKMFMGGGGFGGSFSGNPMGGSIGGGFGGGNFGANPMGGGLGTEGTFQGGMGGGTGQMMNTPNFPTAAYGGGFGPNTGQNYM